MKDSRQSGTSRPAWIAGTAVLALALLVALRLITGRDAAYGFADEVTAPRAILLVHGLDDPGALWDETIQALAADGWPVHEFIYPNDQAITLSTRMLADELWKADLEEVVFVGHSMGCLVIRDLLSEPQRSESIPPPQLRVRGAVLIAPPNHGSRLAPFRAGLEVVEQLRRLSNPDLELTNPWREGSGEAGADLSPGSPFLEQLNGRSWPVRVPTRTIIGYDSPVEFRDAEEKQQILAEHLANGETPDFPFPEVLDGYGDGSVAVRSALHPDFSEVTLIDAIHRPMVDRPETREIIDAALRSWLTPEHVSPDPTAGR